MKTAVLQRIVALVLVGVALASTLFWLRLPDRLPTDDDWRHANEWLSTRVQPGDVVVLAPAWAERGRQFLTAAPVEAGFDLAHDEYPGTQRQWLVALPDAPRFDLEAARAALRARGAALGAGERLGQLFVEGFAIAGPPQLHAFTDHVADATVSLDGPNGGACRKGPDGRHQCNRGEWNNVHPGWFEVGERPFHGLWAHPVGREALRLTWDDVPLGRAVSGRAAFVGSAGKGGAPVELTVEIDGQVAGSKTFAPSLRPQPFALPLVNPPARGRVAILVTTPDSGMRHFAFDAWTSP